MVHGGLERAGSTQLATERLRSLSGRVEAGAEENGDEQEVAAGPPARQELDLASLVWGFSCGGERGGGGRGGGGGGTVAGRLPEAGAEAAHPAARAPALQHR